jgi:hypothetical protein
LRQTGGSWERDCHRSRSARSGWSAAGSRAFHVAWSGKTVAISHDDRYFAVADRMITLESGQVVSDVRTAQALSSSRLVGAADGGRAVG